MKAVFFSDTHLGRRDAQKAKIVETFIREVCRDADMVFLLGDLFEFYHGHKDYIYPWFIGVADALRELTSGGTSVYFMEGNHEFAMGLFFQSYTGVVCVDEMTVDLDGKRVFVSHGDKFVGGAVRNILKARFTAGVMDFLGPRLTWAIAMGARLFLSKKVKPYNKAVADIFRGYARKKLAEGFDAVVLGHSHMPDRVEYGSGAGRKVYFNTGDFISQSTYVSYESASGFALKKNV